MTQAIRTALAELANKLAAKIFSVFSANTLTGLHKLLQTYIVNRDM